MSQDHIHCHLQKAGTGAPEVHVHDVLPGAASERSWCHLRTVGNPGICCRQTSFFIILVILGLEIITNCDTLWCVVYKWIIVRGLGVVIEWMATCWAPRLYTPASEQQMVASTLCILLLWGCIAKLNLMLNFVHQKLDIFVQHTFYFKGLIF